MLLAHWVPPCPTSRQIVPSFLSVNCRCSAKKLKHLQAYSPDVVALGNLCVDVVIPVRELPSEDHATKKKLLKAWEASPSSEGDWELGGATNFLFAAARLGMMATSLGHVGDDMLGKFLVNELRREGVEVKSLSCVENEAAPWDPQGANSTEVCLVMVDPCCRHGFCSNRDIEKRLHFGDHTPIHAETQRVLRSTKGAFFTGYILDECSLGYVKKLCDLVHDGGGALFFDPGPRGSLCMQEDAATREAFLDLMRMADVVLLTREEAADIVGGHSVEEYADRVLGQPASQTRWCVIKDGPQGSMIKVKGVDAPVFSKGYRVPVLDTVGCGDSFAAAVAMGYLRDCHPCDVLALANAVGAGTAMMKGAGRNVASRQVILDILRKNGNSENVQGAMGMLGAAPVY